MAKNWKERFPHYSMCDDCAKAKGGVPSGDACTVTQGTCPYCGTENVTLTPWVDYDWPGDVPATLTARLTRD